MLARRKGRVILNFAKQVVDVDVENVGVEDDTWIVMRTFVEHAAH